MSVDIIKAKVAAGVLPRPSGVHGQPVRYTSGVCGGCDVMIESNEIGVQFDSDDPERLLHPSCYVLWIEACAT